MVNVSIPYRLNEIGGITTIRLGYQTFQFLIGSMKCRDGHGVKHGGNVSIPYRLNEINLSPHTLPLSNSFQFLIGSMKL